MYKAARLMRALDVRQLTQCAERMRTLGLRLRDG